MNDTKIYVHQKYIAKLIELVYHTNDPLLAELTLAFAAVYFKMRKKSSIAHELTERALNLLPKHVEVIVE